MIIRCQTGGVAVRGISLLMEQVRVVNDAEFADSLRRSWLPPRFAIGLLNKLSGAGVQKLQIWWMREVGRQFDGKHQRRKQPGGYAQSRGKPHDLQHGRFILLHFCPQRLSHSMTRPSFVNGWYTF